MTLHVIYTMPTWCHWKLW